MKAEIITIGDEILIGQIIDTNSQWISKELNEIGVSVYQITSIQDEEQHILNALQEAENRADIVLITGGLGPTKDDITKKTIAKYFNDKEIIFYPEVFEHITTFFNKLGKPVNEVQKYQAELPSKAVMLFNELGTAPGMWFEKNNTIFVSLPGVPYEMKNLMTNKVLPRLHKQLNLPFICHTTIHTFGMGESFIAERLSSFETRLPNFIKLAYLPSLGTVRLRLSGKHDNKEVLHKTINSLVTEVQQLLPEIISGIGEQGGLENQIGMLLKQQNKTLCTAESMTGGKIASKIVSVSGASSYFKGSFVTYFSELKERFLGVSAQLIKKNSAVCKEVAEIMAVNARIKMGADYAISITGNAGPTTNHNDKKVGLVYIGISSLEKTEVYEFNFELPRNELIDRTVTKALELLQKNISKN